MFTVSGTLKRLKKIAALTACATAFFAVGAIDSPVTAKSTVITAEKTWQGETVEHKNFKDLGNYIIELPDFTNPSIEKKGISAMNSRYDHGDISKIGCTAMITKNSKGEVVIGRNMDLEISQSPAYVYKTTFGKYENYCVSYMPSTYKTYEEIQQSDEIDENWMNLLIYNACDCMNEKGLYIEVNLREPNPKLSNYGLHSAHGEINRADGTPWKDLRTCTVAIPQLVSQNCATVKEAVEFLKNSYDWYTVNLPNNPHYSGCNMCFVIGDATGEYGLIEVAQDEVSYIPYQYGQGNFYITPRWKVLDVGGSGIGRLAKVSEVIGGVETLEDAMDAMKPIMWRNETLWLGESVRADKMTHQNPYNQIIFQDDKGNSQLDWRSDYVTTWPVLDDGRMIMSAQVYEDAKKSTHDPKIKEYIDEAVSRGKLVVDDGSIKFDVNGKKVTLTELSDKYDAFAASDDSEKRAELEPYFNEYARLVDNQNLLWNYNDYNFEALKAVAYAKLHIRYNAEGKFDNSCMSKYEKLLAFYGYGVPKDESHLRTDASIWTTSVNVGANCARKEMKIRFWENDNVIYHVKF
ncbi:MAG: linear amide C-N hydrolase [Selenomonadaceae bacterium]|nr:linear amide C-N hydrolase [Selenomonadaceae bacterium]